MDMSYFETDYRKYVIQKWIIGNIDTFKQPTDVDLDKHFKYYHSLVKTFIPNKKDIKILEIGCGWGGFIHTLKNCGYQNISAIDIIPDVCDFVQKRFTLQNVYCIDALTFFINNYDLENEYDVIAAFDVLEHFNKNEILFFLSLILRALNQNGIFIMRAPNAECFRGIYIRYSGFTHEVAFTKLSINELFKVVGFKRVFCIPEPDSEGDFIVKRALKKIRNIFLARLLGLDPKYIMSTNIIGIGFKS